MFWTVLIIPQILSEFEYLNSAEFWPPSPDNYSQFWSRWFPDQRTEPKTQLLRLASVKNYKSYVILELPLRFFELSPMNKEHQRLGVSRYSLVYVYCFFAQLRKFLKLRLRFSRERTSEPHAHHADGHAHHAHIFSSDFVCALHIVSKSRAWVVNKFVLAHLFVAV